FPFESAEAVTFISEVTDLISSENSTSKSSNYLKPTGFSASPNHFATCEREVPCTIKEIKVQKNTILNIKSAWGTSAAKTIIAKIIGTAPRKPTQEINVLDLKDIFLKGSKQRNTLRGRVIKIIKKLMINPGTMIGINSDGLMSNPKVRNISS